MVFNGHSNIKKQGQGVEDDVEVRSHASVRIREWKCVVKRKAKNMSPSLHKVPDCLHKGVAKVVLLEKHRPITCNVALAREGRGQRKPSYELVGDVGAIEVGTQSSRGKVMDLR